MGMCPTKSVEVASTLGIPPTQCDGYPYPIIPDDIQDEINFFVPKPQGGSLACSLYRHPTSDGTAAPPHGCDTTIPVIIVCHGYAAWRNQMLLAHLAGGLFKRGYHTLRFDFTGNGHSTGNFRFSNFDGEFGDLQTVISYVQNELKCKVACIIGHSKAAATVFRTAVDQEYHGEKGRRISCFVNLSGRFHVPGEYNLEPRFSPDQVQELRRTGKILVGRQGTRDCFLTNEDVEERQKLDSSVVEKIKSSFVLTIHGAKDVVIDVANAREFDKRIPLHELHILEDADHNYNGLRHMATLVDMISNFVERHHSPSLTGIH